MELIKQNTQSQMIKSLLIIFVGSVVLAISAKIKIPFYPVPMTMQTFIVLFLGISFGYKIALATVGLYLLEGIMGFPVFSNSPERGIGLTYFTGPTMGYLIGFLTATFLASYVKLSDNYFIIFLKLTLSVSTIYILGVFWLGTLIGWEKQLHAHNTQIFAPAGMGMCKILHIHTFKTHCNAATSLCTFAIKQSHFQ